MPPPPCSAFIAPSELPPDDVGQSHLARALGHHPSYLACLRESAAALHEDDGSPLPRATRAHIALVAAARHGSMYQLGGALDALAAAGGDVSWLRGGGTIPAAAAGKLGRLAEVNALLAHRPWLLTTAHMRELVEGGASDDGGGGWTVTELVHAIVIMSHEHALSSLALALGVLREPSCGSRVGLQPAPSPASAPLPQPLSPPPTPRLAALYSAQAVAAGERELRSLLLAAAAQDTGALDEADERELSGEAIGGAAGGSGGGRGTSSVPGELPLEPTHPTTPRPSPPPLALGAAAAGGAPLASAGGGGGGGGGAFSPLRLSASSRRSATTASPAAVQSTSSGTSDAGPSAAEDDDDEERGGWNLGGQARRVTDEAAAAAAADDLRSAASAAAAAAAEGVDEEDNDEDDDDDGAESFERAGEGALLLDASTTEASGGGMSSSASSLAAAAAIEAAATPLQALAAEEEVGAGMTPLARRLASFLTGRGPLRHLPPAPDAVQLGKHARKRLRRQRSHQSEGESHDVCLAAGGGLGGVVGGSGGIGGSGGGGLSAPVPPPDIAGLTYRDFDVTQEHLVTHDFSWEVEAFGLLQRYFPAAAAALDRETSCAFCLTYRTFGRTDRDIDTEPFRNAIWYYCQRLFGVRDDVYDYSTVNKLLPIPIKTFVKQVACYPNLITALDFATFTQTFSVSEKTHIVLLIVEARRQAALLWALRAVTRFLTERHADGTA